MNSKPSIYNSEFNLDKNKKKKVSLWAEIWELPSGEKSLHAAVEIMPDEVITSFIVKERLAKPNYLSIQSNEREHFMVVPEYLHYINHSCEPNVFFNTSSQILTCLKKIEVGEEIRFFYPSTDWSFIQPFNCHCNSQSCLGKIQGAAYLNLDTLQLYQLSDYILEKI